MLAHLIAADIGEPLDIAEADLRARLQRIIAEVLASKGWNLRISAWRLERSRKRSTRAGAGWRLWLNGAVDVTEGRKIRSRVEQPSDYGANNKLVTKERYEQLKARLKEKFAERQAAQEMIERIAAGAPRSSFGEFTLSVEEIVPDFERSGANRLIADDGSL